MTDPLVSDDGARETLPVELVDDSGRAIGTASVAAAHRTPGLQHRAFSVVLFDSAGRLLLQQRAPAKTRFPALWSNTCCGHPAPGEAVTAAAMRRLSEEMGMRATLAEAGIYRYRAADTGTGQVESEWDHVLIGRPDIESPRPDAAEVGDYTWIRPDELRAALTTNPQEYTPWLAGVLDIAERAHRDTA
ncbi:isopentenyl-diphosphate Delta-isomerase [Nocardia sp. CNY236]|uniref:isopentenyl-diphosphate Delta-isomerase n=1 Tax=Nocardia sp. CNY236 TaxID=1169152 RepID=UPI0018CB4679|nr:isopentenyl-diphosphate Delta-isomerase [Nocardia sp. CNY236]